MDYKLCKQLKEAGFPQPKNGQLVEGILWEEEDNYHPHLEELIEWCREKCFGGMIHLNVMSDGIWGAIGELPHDGILTEMGKTPSISMALLGLKLHE